MILMQHSKCYILIFVMILYGQKLLADELHALMKVQIGSGVNAQAAIVQSNESCFSGACKLKQAAFDRWNDLPTWGKCVVVGTTASALVGSVLLYKHVQKNNMQHKMIEEFVLIKRPTEDLRAALLKGDAHEQLVAIEDDQKVSALKEVFQQVIRRRYTTSEESILKHIVQHHRKLFVSNDWFELWKYACENEHAKNEYDLRNWLGRAFVIQLQIKRSDIQIVVDALNSGVNLLVPTIMLEEASNDALSSSSEDNSAPLLFAAVYLLRAYPKTPASLKL